MTDFNAFENLRASGGVKAPLPSAPVRRAARLRPDVRPDLERVAKQQAPEQPDDGFSFGDVLGGLLSAVDYGRAAVTSGVKEATDFIYASPVGEALSSLPLIGESDEERAANLERMGTASWQDFKDQLNRRMGFQEVLDATGMPGGWQRSALGFIGDVALDPLTYLTAGVGGVAKNVAFKPVAGGLREALYQGGGTGIAKYLAEKAAVEGVKSPALDRLVVQAAERGAGALTERGLARAGISEAERLALGLSKAPTNKAAKMLQVWEDLKGGIKAPVKTNVLVQKGRGAFGRTIGGESKFARILYDKAVTPEMRAEAATAMSTIGKSLSEARKWGNNTVQRVYKSWGKPVSKLSEEERIAFTHGIESRVDDQLMNAGRADFERMGNEARAAGVPLGDVATPDRAYVPHYVTDDWRKLAEVDPEAAEFVYTTDLLTLEGSQKGRLLFEGGTFLGQPLHKGTIKEINDIALKVKGTKIFHDDIAEILPRYADQLTKALGRQKQIDLLVERGLSVETATRIQKELVEPERLKQLDDEIVKTKATIDRVRGEQKVELQNGEVIRRNQLDAAIGGVTARRDEAVAALKQAEADLAESGRLLNEARTRLARKESEISSLEASRDGWAAVVRSERGPARKRASRAVARVEKQIADARAEADGLRTQVSKLLGPESNMPLTDAVTATRPMVQQEQAVRSGIEDMRKQVDDLNNQIAELSLKKNPPGQGPLPSDNRVLQAQVRLEKATLNRDRLLSEEAAAAQAYDLASVPAAQQARILADVEAQLAKIQQVVSGAGKPGRVLTKRGKVKADIVVDHVTDLADRVKVVRTVLERSGDDVTVQTIAGLEAAAQAADAAILSKGEELVQLEDLVKSLTDQRFIDRIIPEVKKGMVNLPNGQSIPQWIADATEIDWAIKQLPLIGDFMNKYMNVWKGYAILRPGFHARNAYSAMMNMYLEAGHGVFKNVKKFEKFYKLLRENPDGYMDDAIRIFGETDARMLDDAWGAVAATGSGQTAGEFSSGALKAGGWNPASPEFKPLKVNRRFGEAVENRVRGAHAYDVLHRGGTLDQAIDVVNKWHFNYTDVTDFDRAMKLVNPFWTFFSRNLALQAQTWYRIPGRLNRSYANLERNLGYGKTPDTDVPEWFQNAGAIRFGVPNQAGDVNYLFPDLPAVQFGAQLDALANPTDLRFLADTAPWVKALPEMWAGKQAFSGIPFKDQAQAGTSMQLLDRLLPGAQTEMGADGQRVTNDMLQYQLSSLVPGFGQLNTLAPLINTAIPGGSPLPVSQKALDREKYTALSQLLGIGVRPNTDSTRWGEQYRRAVEAGLVKP